MRRAMATRRTNGLSYWPIRIMALPPKVIRVAGRMEPGKAPRAARRGLDRRPRSVLGFGAGRSQARDLTRTRMLHTHHAIYMLLSLLVAVLGSWTALDLF